MKKPNLFFDFDDFLFKTRPAIASFLNTYYDISIQDSELVNMGNHLEVLVNKHLTSRTLSREEVYDAYGRFFLPSLEKHMDVQPFEGMCQVVHALSKKYAIWTVTARQKHSAPVLDAILQKYVSTCIQGIHCVWENLGNGNFKQISKRDFIRSVPGKNIAFFDDSPQEIERMQDMLPSYLFDPDHLHDDMKHIQYRVHSWKEIGEIFL